MTAERLDACLRPGDVVARGSGDDFLVLLRNIGGEAEVVRVAERIRRMLTGGYAVDEHEVFCGSDVGVALGEAGSADADALLRAAETATSSAHRMGRVQVFRPEMRTDAVHAMRLETDLRHALERGELRVYYQPVVGLGDGRVHGFEALVRWEHPVRGLVSPADFIPVAEDTDLIIPIGEWMLRQAALQLRDWQARDPERPLGMGVNLSVRQFRPTLVEQVRAQDGVHPRPGLSVEPPRARGAGPAADHRAAAQRMTVRYASRGARTGRSGIVETRGEGAGETVSHAGSRDYRWPPYNGTGPVSPSLTATPVRNER